MLNHLHRNLTPEGSLYKQLSWLLEKMDACPYSPNTSVTIALIAADRLYWLLQAEGKVLALTEANWRWVLKYAEVDLVLIESCSESATGDWFMAQMAPEMEQCALWQVVETAKAYKIPVAYWFTQDDQYLSLYQPMIERMTHVFSIDEKVDEELASQRSDLRDFSHAEDIGIPVYESTQEWRNALLVKESLFMKDREELRFGTRVVYK